jgi:outer membrane protein assembly factor BamB
MNLQRNKTLSATALILIMTFAMIMASAQSARAISSVSIKTFAFVSPNPNLVGVGQQILINFGIDHISPIATATGNLLQGFTIAIARPDGTTETLNGNVDSTSQGYLIYVPTQIGTYKLTCNFAGQWVNVTAGEMTGFGPAALSVNYYFQPSTSGQIALKVQQQPVAGVTPSSPPNDYWTRPINAENKGWAAYTDNWLMAGYDTSPRFFNGMGAFSPNTTAPNSAHILWTLPLQEGGLVSAKFGDNNFYPSEIYEQYYLPLILNGKIIYVDHGPTATGGQGGTGSNRIDNFGTRCLDLYTGKEIWYLANVTIDLAQTVLYNSVNKHAVLPYLWSMPGISSYGPVPAPPTSGLTWTMYDAYTGNQILNIMNANSGFPVFGPSGEILVYTIDFGGHWLAMWNSTKCVLSYPLAPGSQANFFSPSRGTVLDWNAGLEWNVTLNAPNAYGTPGLWGVSLSDNVALVMYEQRLFYPTDQPTFPATLTDVGYPIVLKPDANGNYPSSLNPIWVQNRTNIFDYVEPHVNINEGMYSFYDDAAQVVHTYSIANGNEISASPPLSNGELYTVFSHTWMAYGNTYVWGYDGHVRCVDGKTGKITWDTFLGELPYTGATSFSAIPVYQGPNIADGKVYIAGNNHSPDSNLWVGDKLFALDAFTGQVLWNISSYVGQPGAISDGYLTTYNGYDVTIYTYGKGPSATTVSVPQTAIPSGTPVMISGTVTDKSPGQPDTPAISDENQAAWMEYLHMQKPLDITHVKGVTVQLSAHASDGSTIDLGTATTDANGLFSKLWTPPAEGEYRIIASFAGTNSYGSSHAEAPLGVAGTSASSSSSAPLDLYIIVATVLIIIAIAVVGILVLRKRPKP